MPVTCAPGFHCQIFLSATFVLVFTFHFSGLQTALYMHITTLMPTLSKILIRHLIQPHFASVHEHTLLEALQNRKKKEEAGRNWNSLKDATLK